MTTRTALQGAVTFAGPLVLAAGAAMLIVALTGSQSGSQAALPRPQPTVTVTAPIPPQQPTPTPQQTPEPGAGVGRAVGVVVAAQRPGGADGGMEAEPGGGADHPPTSPAQACPRGRVLTLNLPVGVLPCDSLVIGGRNEPQPTEGQ